MCGKIHLKGGNGDNMNITPDSVTIKLQDEQLQKCEQMFVCAQTNEKYDS